jgi:hypothetical protein
LFLSHVELVIKSNQDKRKMKIITKDPIEQAWLTYEAKKDDLLKNDRGKYAWVVGSEILAVESDRVELCKTILERGQEQKGIIMKIEEDSPPTEEIFSFDLD